jgi:hypothetical protein
MSAIPKAITVLAGSALLFGLVPGAVGEQIVIPFSVQAQAGSTATTYTISGSLISIPPIDGPAGRLAAEVTLIDGNGDGATLTGQRPTGNSIEAYYDVSNLFGGILSQVIAPPGGTIVWSEAFPPSGYEPFPSPPTSVSVQMKFMLSAYDSVDINGSLTIMPEPTGGLLLALLGLVSTRFRR